MDMMEEMYDSDYEVDNSSTEKVDDPPLIECNNNENINTHDEADGKEISEKTDDDEDEDQPVANEQEDSSNVITIQDTAVESEAEAANTELPRQRSPDIVQESGADVNSTDDAQFYQISNDHNGEQEIPSLEEEHERAEDRLDSHSQYVALFHNERVIEGQDGDLSHNDVLELDPDATLANQQAEKEAMQGLIDSNVVLEKEAVEMRTKISEMEQQCHNWEKTVEELNSKNSAQEEKISSLERELADAKFDEESKKSLVASNQKVDDLEKQLKRLAIDDHDKSERIRSLEVELEARKDTPPAPRSKACTIL